MKIWAILPAAGVGLRMGSNTPKQYLPLNGKPVIEQTLSRLTAVSSIEEIIVVVHAQDETWSTIKLHENSKLVFVEGGEERHLSILNGLLALKSKAHPDDWVLVHDAVRPCVRVQDIEHLVNELKNHPVGGLLGTPVVDTLKRVNSRNEILQTIDRSGIWNAFTPQMFRYGLLLDALMQIDDSVDITDEAYAIERLGRKPKFIEGRKDNIKVTHAGDLKLAEEILQVQATEK
jgi:2-C-methyl-D-erythritol 4-phosphate cytidylyltransferase